MKIKTTLRFHFTLVRMIKIKNQNLTNAGMNIGKGKHLFTVSESANLYSLYENQCGAFPKC